MPTIQNIEENEYGNVSRPKINSNFQELETAVDNLDTNKENTFAQLPLTK